MDPLAWLDATAQAELVRKGEVTAAELVAAAIGRIERLNPTLNAVITPLYDLAYAAAAGPQAAGPFAGVPTLVKDLNTHCAGVRTTGGSRLLRDFVPAFDSIQVARLKQAGFIVVGKSNTPEFGALPTTEPQLFGPVRNPWDTSRSAGGSSGGAAAAVAAGLVPVAHASDGGGSIRIPAACCGLFGLKPSRGRVSVAPLPDTLGLSCHHAVTRSVRDSAALLDALAGPAPGDVFTAPPPARPFLQEVGAPPGRLRVAFSTAPFTGAPVHPDCAAAVADAAALLAELGHAVTEAAPDIDGDLVDRSFRTLWFCMMAAGVDAAVAQIGRPARPEDLEPATWAMAEAGRRVTAPQFLAAQATLHTVARQVAAFFGRYEIWLTPTVAAPPPPLGHFDPLPDHALSPLDRSAAFTPFTPLINATGQPAMSVPLAWNHQGLPIGVHLVARYAEEATLFRLAAQLEAARPWANRRPPVRA